MTINLAGLLTPKTELANIDFDKCMDGDDFSTIFDLSVIPYKTFFPESDDVFECNNPFKLPAPKPPKKTIDYAALIEDPEVKAQYEKIINGNFVVKVWECYPVVMLCYADPANYETHSCGVIAFTKGFSRSSPPGIFSASVGGMSHEPSKSGPFCGIENEAFSFLLTKVLYWTIRRHSLFFTEPENIGLFFRALMSAYVGRRMWDEAYEIAVLSARWGATQLVNGKIPEALMTNKFAWPDWTHVAGNMLRVLGRYEEAGAYYAKASEIFDEGAEHRIVFLQMAALSLSTRDCENAARYMVQCFNISLQGISDANEWWNTKMLCGPVHNSCSQVIFFEFLLIIYRNWATNLKMNSRRNPATYLTDAEKHHNVLAALLLTAGISAAGDLKLFSQDMVSALLLPDFHAATAAKQLLFKALSAGGIAKFSRIILRARHHNTVVCIGVTGDTSGLPALRATDKFIKSDAKRYLLDSFARFFSDVECKTCNKRTGEMFRCSKCRAFGALYCCKECFAKDWENHKPVCMKLRKT
jgi:hypothetical protein